MPYNPILVKPMRDELTSIGVQELTTPDEVDSFLQQDDTALLIFNSVCGCAAGQARPGVRLALESDVKPARVGTVFAGQDVEATAQARANMSDIPPSSPSMALFKDRELVYFLPRHRIEGRDAGAVADDLKQAFSQHCSSGQSA